MSVSGRGEGGGDAVAAELDVAALVFGNRTKIRILRYLSAHPTVDRAQLEAATAIHGPTLSLNMQQLEDANLVIASLPREKRRGRVLSYTLNRERMDMLLSLLTSYIAGTGAERDAAKGSDRSS